MSNKDSLPSMSGDLTLPKKDEIKFADYRDKFALLPSGRRIKIGFKKETAPLP